MEEIMKFPIRTILALALAFGFAAALAQDASAASKRHHHATTTSKPSMQYLQAAPQK
jgi:hypothetical protein